MSYEEVFLSRRASRHYKVVAGGILKELDEVRDQRSVASRRWVWELIQNAKDAAKPGDGVAIELNVTLDEDQKILEFRHNGGFFSLQNIEDLIEKDSSKREIEAPVCQEDKKTGKFGTGFLTTHLLSEKVLVKGFLEESGSELRYFEVPLDRSGTTESEVIQSLEQSMSALIKSLDSPTSQNIRPNQFNTTFRYELDDKGLHSAEIGLADLDLVLPYVLVFVPRIHFLSIKPKGIFYRRKRIREINESMYVEQIDISNIDNSVPFSRQFLVHKNEHVTILIEIDASPETKNISILPNNKLVPRLFCDFPLIGTEDFPFPVILNSSFFNPTVSRDGIWLSDPTRPKHEENRRLLVSASELFIDLLEHLSAENAKGLHHLLNTQLPPSRYGDEILPWYKNEVQQYLRREIVKIPLVDTPKHGRLPINTEGSKSIYFPFYPKDHAEAHLLMRNCIWDLSNRAGLIVPLQEDTLIWQSVLWTEDKFLDLKRLYNWVQKNRTLETLASTFQIKVSLVLDWLNRFYELIEKDESALSLVRTDTIKVIPNREGTLVERSCLRRSDEVEPPFFEVLANLGDNPNQWLVHEGLSIATKTDESGVGITIAPVRQSEIIEKINQKFRQNTSTAAAINILISLFAEDENFPPERLKIYQFCKDLIGDEIPDKLIIKTWSPEIWEECDGLRLRRLKSEISACQNLETLRAKLKAESLDTVLKWLNDFIQLLQLPRFKDLLTSEDSPILPNQNGDFKTKAALSADNIEDEDLKDIALWLGFDCREDIIHPAIEIEFAEKPKWDKGQIAAKIVQLLSPKLGSGKDGNVKKAARGLLRWINDNPQEAKDLFTDYHKNRYLLFDEEEMAEMMQKVYEYDQIQSMLREQEGVSNDDIIKLLKRKDIKKLLEEDTETESTEEKTESIQSILIRLSIASIEQYKKALEDPRTAKYFTHTSTPTIEMFEVVQGLIRRSKSRIKEHLVSLPAYDCANWDDTQSLTVIKGVSKHVSPDMPDAKRNLLIVIRPADGGKVIFYYPEEFEAMSSLDHELWIDDGEKNPRPLTPGEIFRKNKINKLYI